MKCPLKEDNFGRMPECQPDCACLMVRRNTDLYACAFAVSAMNDGEKCRWEPANRDEVGR